MRCEIWRAMPDTQRSSDRRIRESARRSPVTATRWCRLCGTALPPGPRQGGRPRTTHYPACPGALDPLEVLSDTATGGGAQVAATLIQPVPADDIGQTGGVTSVNHLGAPPPAIVRDPFNSTPGTAPLPPSAVHDPQAGPGPIEQKLMGDLERIVSTNPLASTLGMIALRCARAADLAPADDLKAVLAAVKELRAIMGEISKQHTGGDDDDSDATPVGSSAPQVVHTPAL